MAEEAVTQPETSNERVETGRRANALRQKRSNQFIKARERAREALDVESYRKQIKVGLVLAKLHSAAMGKTEMSPVAVQAAKVLMDKAIPTLQAVETSNVEIAITRSEPELLCALRELMLAHPSLVAQILGEQRSLPVAVQSDSQVIDVTDDTSQQNDPEST